LGHDVDTVASEGLKGGHDSDIWSAARRDDRLLITQDLDFSDIRQFTPGTHPGLLLVRLREPEQTQFLAGLAMSPNGKALIHSPAVSSF
jgi:predicted nuclease of predicted toxin-antitoxin system